MFAGAKAGSKKAKAEALGVPVLDEAALIAVLEGGAPDGAPASGLGLGRFPFRFFGHNLTDWRDTALWLLAWSKPWLEHDPAEREGVARCLADAFSPANDFSFRVTEGSWAMLETTGADGPRHEAMFSAVEALFLALHQVAPLEEVLNATACGVEEDELQYWAAQGARPRFNRPFSVRGVGVHHRIDVWCDDAEQQAEPIAAFSDVALDAAVQRLRTAGSDVALEKALASGELAWVSVPAPKPVALSAEEQVVFEGCQEKLFVRSANGTLIGYHTTATKLILAQGSRVGQVPLPAKWPPKRLSPSASGERFLYRTDRGGSFGDNVGRGHAEEVGLGREPEVLITANQLDKYGAPTLWAVDYLVDDDTVVAQMGSGRESMVLLLKRSTETGRFEEVDNIQGSGTHLATSGPTIALDGSKNVVLYGVIDDQLIKIGSVARPETYGVVYAHPAATREELRFRGNEHHRLVNWEGLLATKKAKKPPRNTLSLRRITGHHPSWMSAARKEALFANCWDDCRLYKKLSVSFISGAGFIAARMGLDTLWVAADGTRHHASPGELFLDTVHPSEERALGYTKEGALVEVNLVDMASTPLADPGVQASYVRLSNRELILVFDSTAHTASVYEREALSPGLGQQVGTVELRVGDSVQACGSDRFLLKVADKKANTHHLLQVEGGDQGEVTFGKSGKLVLPGKRYSKLPVWAASVAGRGYVRAGDFWFHLPSV